MNADMRDMEGLVGMMQVGKWEKPVDSGANLGKVFVGSWGLRVGSWTHFSIGHLGELDSLRRQVLEILACLSLGI